MTLGLSFQPQAANSTDEANGSGQHSAPVQEAIRLISLRLPSVTGARGISPQAILAQGGGQGSALSQRLGGDVATQLMSGFAPSSQKRDLLDMVFRLYAGGGTSSSPSSQPERSTVRVSGGALTPGAKRQPPRGPGVSVTAGVQGPDDVSTTLPPPSSPAPTPISSPPAQKPLPVNRMGPYYGGDRYRQ